VQVCTGSLYRRHVAGQERVSRLMESFDA